MQYFFHLDFGGHENSALLYLNLAPLQIIRKLETRVLIIFKANETDDGVEGFAKKFGKGKARWKWWTGRPWACILKPRSVLGSKEGNIWLIPQMLADFQALFEALRQGF